MEITITTLVRVSQENKKQVKYLVEKLAEVEAIPPDDKNMIRDMSEAFEYQKGSFQEWC